MQGGGLVATEQTSLYTEWRRRRKDFGLKECFGISASKWNGPDAAETILPGEPVRVNVGKGRVVYVPEIIPSTKRPIGEEMSSQYWTPAVNHKTLRDAVLWAIGDHPTIQTSRSLSSYVTMNLVYQEADNRLPLHILNYDHVHNPFIQNITIEVSIPGNKKVTGIQTLTPDRRVGKQSLSWSGDKFVRYTIPSMEIYTIAVIDLE